VNKSIPSVAELSNREELLEWLLDEEQPAIRFFTLLELLDKPENDPEVERARFKIPKTGWVASILRKQKPAGYWESKKSLYRPKYTATNWMALVLSDLGMTKNDRQVEKTANLFFKIWLESKEENFYESELCIAGNTARFLTAFGYGEDPRVKKLFDHIVEIQKDDGGWHCWDSPEGTLDCWEGLAAFATLPRSKRSRRIERSIERGVEFYLERRLTNEGNKKYLPWFRLHYPVHYYYDVLVGLDLMTRLGYGGDKRLRPALDILLRKRSSDGTWKLEATHPDPPSYAWGKNNLKSKVKPFSLERVGEPSKIITLNALRILKRVEEA
jgi:hypothetical protein